MIHARHHEPMKHFMSARLRSVFCFQHTDAVKVSAFVNGMRSHYDVNVNTEVKI